MAQVSRSLRLFKNYVCSPRYARKQPGGFQRTRWLLCVSSTIIDFDLHTKILPGGSVGSLYSTRWNHVTHAELAQLPVSSTYIDYIPVHQYPYSLRLGYAPGYSAYITPVQQYMCDIYPFLTINLRSTGVLVLFAYTGRAKCVVWYVMVWYDNIYTYLHI